MEFTGYPQFEPLSPEWTWDNRKRLYRVRFVDGDEYVMSSVQASQDIGEAPHAVANIEKVLQRAAARNGTRRTRSFFTFSTWPKLPMSSQERSYFAPPNMRLKLPGAHK